MNYDSEELLDLSSGDIDLDGVLFAIREEVIHNRYPSKLVLSHNQETALLVQWKAMAPADDDAPESLDGATLWGIWVQIKSNMSDLPAWIDGHTPSGKHVVVAMPVDGDVSRACVEIDGVPQENERVVLWRDGGTYEIFLKSGEIIHDGRRALVHWDDDSVYPLLGAERIR